ncbi:MAG: T9SS type A sorting domain-containing protein [Bacteroidia bacterium]
MKKLLLILSAVFCLTENNAQVLNTSFCANATNGTVMATAVDSVNNIVYIGGAFTQVCGSPRKNLAAFNLSTGALMTFSANVNANVFSMYYYNHALYIGGSFTTVNAQSHNYVAKFNTSSNTLSTWAPNITTGSSVNAIVAKGNRVYLGGNFLLTIATGKNICDLDTGTATANPWPAYPDNQVNALSIEGNSIYAGGGFSNIGTTPMAYLAKFSVGTGALDAAWAPNPDASVYSLCATGGRLFVGGSFSYIGPSVINRPYLADIDTSSADPTSWNPSPDNSVISMGYRNGHLYTAGNFTVLGGRTKNYLGVVDVISGLATNWDAQMSTSPQSLSLAPGKIAFGGSFTTVLGQSRAGFAVVCINPIDTITLSPDGPTNVCNGLSGVSYSVTPVSGATSYVWSYSGTGATINGTSNAVTIDFSSSATSGTLTVKGTNGCESTNIVSLPITTYTFTTTTSPNSTNIACGDSTTLGASDNYQGSGTTSFSWTPSAGLNITNDYQVRCGTKTTRTYTVTETSTDGCVAKDFVTVTVDPYNLTTSQLASSILCSTKDSLHVINDYIGYGVVTYTWSPAASVSLPNGANVSVNPVVTTDYTVTSSSTDGCSALAQVITVVVDPILLNAGSTSSNITCGESTQLSASNNYPGTGTLTYTWSPATALNNTHITNPNANPIATTDYTLTMNSPEGCVSTDHTTINVNALQVNTAGTYSVNCHQPITLSTSANTSNSNLTYSWTPSSGLSSTTAASPTAVVGSNATYNVTMSLPSSGCADASNSVNLVLTAPSTPQICMVTVDSASTHNIVYWDKTSFANSAIDSFRIYREISLGTYSIVGSVHYNALSEFHDYGANPNVTTYRYKITALDSCGLESQQSLYHNTIYIVYVGSGQYTWNPGYTIEPSTNPVNNYLLMRDDNNNGTWHQVASTVGNQNTIADPAWASFPNANWQVVTSWNISCTSTLRTGNNGVQATIIKSKSNITNNRTTGIKNAESNFNVYPNPTNGNITIAFTNGTTGKTTIKITSLLGAEVYNETILVANEKQNVDISKYENGVYTVQVTNVSGTFVKRIVKSN